LYNFVAQVGLTSLEDVFLAVTEGDDGGAGLELGADNTDVETADTTAVDATETTATNSIPELLATGPSNLDSSSSGHLLRQFNALSSKSALVQVEYA
jgi:hypothetical protein